MKIFVAFCITFTSICAVHSARILGVFTAPSHSHYQLGDKVLKGLAGKGHEVTVITPYAEKIPMKNFKQIVLTESATGTEEVRSNMFDFADLNIIKTIIMNDKIGLKWTEDVLNHTKVKDLLKSNQQFDLVILHQFINDAYKGFCYHFNAPCVVLSSMPAPFWINPQMGNTFNPSYIPDLLVELPSKMNFFQRLYNTFVSVTTQLVFHFDTFPKQNELLQKYFPGAPHLSDLYHNISLMLINSHVSANAPVPYQPNMVEIGGCHINPPKKLPEDLQKYLDAAKDGVIYFSMGSNLKTKNLPEEKRNAILQVFSKLKQKVLWKWEDEKMPNQPENVLIRKWFPQQDVLAHPNIKLIITHGGLLSTIETIYFGIPLIGIPIFSDQRRNMASAEFDGYGITVSYSELNEETLGHAINEILSNPRYLDNAKKRSAIMHDQPMKPLDKAIFWVEYVLRHQGATHLRSAALNLTWYQYLLLDVVAFVVLIASVVLYVLAKVVCRLFSKKKVKKVSEHKKKN